jgi:ADP-ribose pyrophosphatase
MASDNREKKISSKEVFKGRILDIYDDEVLCPNGRTAHREVVRHCKAAAILAIDDDGSLILEDQYRYPYDATIKEIPAGKADSLDEDPLVTAKRELKEETGYTADRWTLLGPFYPSAGYSDEVIYLYLAEGLHEGERHLDPDETLTYRKVPFDEALKMVERGEIPDGKTLAAIAYYAARRINKGGH